MSSPLWISIAVFGAVTALLAACCGTGPAVQALPLDGAYTDVVAMPRPSVTVVPGRPGASPGPTATPTGTPRP